jgi:hypothetical protein
MKVLILDTGTLITLSMNGLLYILEKLKTPNFKFIITPQVKYEVIDRPIKVPRFELSALRVQELLNNKTLEISSSIIDDSIIKKSTAIFMNTANSCVLLNSKKMKIISEAETSCLALSQELTKKGIENLIAIDERTTRILTEKPQNLERLMSKKLHKPVSVSCDLSLFKKFKFIRSTELVFVAYKKGILNIKSPKALEAVLFATKFKGASVSFDEINELKRL